MAKAKAKRANQVSKWGDATTAIHRGEPHHGRGGPVAPEIVRSSTFTFSSTAEMKRWAEGKSSAYIYTRYGNPTLAIAEEKIAALEGAEAAVVAASGMAAISSALLAVLSAGDEVISTAQLYGGTYRLMRDVFPRMGIRVRHVEADLAGVEELVTTQTRCLYVETPTNPSLRLVDLRRAIELAREFKLVSIVDNTFGSPVLQKPIALGFDMVAHSATKYLGGHSDLIGGAVAGSREWIGRVRENIIYLGGCMDPEGAFLLIRGMKTLGRARRTAVPDGDGGGEVFGGASQGGASALSGAGFASGSSAGAAADVRFWRDAVVRREGRDRGGAKVLRPRADISRWRRASAGWSRWWCCRFILRTTGCRGKNWSARELGRGRCGCR